MTGKYTLRRHQLEAVDPVVHALSASPVANIHAEGQRAQFISACGTGKTITSAHIARKVVRSGRILNFVPTLDLLTQTIQAWKDAGWLADRMLAVCSLADDEAGARSTTHPARMALWLEEMGQDVVVFATYASVSVLIEAHEGFQGITPLTPWSLMIVDEAHRTSGFIGKAWAAVHANALIPAERRLYMTATPRIWDDSGVVPDRATRPGRHVALTRQLAASMDDPRVFGEVAHKLSLADAIERELLANYEIVCLEIRDQALFEQLARSLPEDEDERDEIREARLAAIQVALLRAMSERGISRVLTFHHRTREAEAFASTLGLRAAEYAAQDPSSAPGEVWAEWLYGEHEPSYRRSVLDSFAEQPEGAAAVISNVRVLAEGVDLSADACLFADPRSSVVDTVQIMGRALRQQRPGLGKVASLLVPIFLPAQGGGDEDLLSSRAWEPLVKILQALRAHDEDAVEQLAVPQRESRAAHVLLPEGDEAGEEDLVLDQALADAGEVDEDDLAEAAAEDSDAVFETVEEPARRPVLRFADDRFSAADVAMMVSLRVIVPEHQSWLRGLSALRRWRAAHGDVLVPLTAMDDTGRWPLGRWVTDQRVEYAAGRMDPLRVQLLEAEGMVWNVNDLAWSQGLDVARKWAAKYGHLCAPVAAVLDNYPVGKFLAEARSQSLLPAGTAGALLGSRRLALEGIDPFWCPSWGVVWQRTYYVLMGYLAAGGTLEVPPGELVEGENLGRWMQLQLEQWGELDPEQRDLLEGIGLQAPAVLKVRAPRVGREQRWARNLEAARLFFVREGHLRVPRGHKEALPDGTLIGLGAWRNNVRSSRETLTVEQVRALEEVGMEWA